MPRKFLSDEFEVTQRLTGKMRDTNPVSLHWRPLADKDLAWPIKVCNESQEEIKAVNPFI